MAGGNLGNDHFQQILLPCVDKPLKLTKWSPEIDSDQGHLDFFDPNSDVEPVETKENRAINHNVFLFTQRT